MRFCDLFLAKISACLFMHRDTIPRAISGVVVCGKFLFSYRSVNEAEVGRFASSFVFVVANLEREIAPLN